MKKIMIAAVIVCAAVLAQASQFRWNTAGVMDITGANAFSGTATLYIYANTAGAATATVIDTATMTSGAVALRQVTSDSIVGGENYTVYYTMQDESGNTFTSGTKSFKAPTNATAPAQTFGSTGSWSAAPVPEPTSGLLLLLGVAGLALRRKRA